MKIIAKKGSALEQTIKDMYDRMVSAKNGAQDLVEQAAGVRPTTIYHMFHWGIISLLTKNFVISKEDEPKINPHVLRKKKGEKDVWVPAARYKEGAALAATFDEYAREHEIGEEPLHEFGIHAMDDKNGVSYYCQPSHDKDTDRYLLICSDSIPKGFNKEKLAQDQFEVEY